MLLPRTDTALSDCRSHLQRFPDTDPAVVSYLVRHVAVILCGEMETTITRLIVERVSRGCDDGAANLVMTVRRNLVRNARPAELADKVALFGDKPATRYQELVEATVGDGGLSRLGTLVKHRDATAHSTPLDLTFAELEKAYSDADSLMQAAEQALIVDSPLSA